MWPLNFTMKAMKDEAAKTREQDRWRRERQALDEANAAAKQARQAVVEPVTTKLAEVKSEGSEQDPHTQLLLGLAGAALGAAIGTGAWLWSRRRGCAPEHKEKKSAVISKVPDVREKRQGHAAEPAAYT